MAIKVFGRSYGLNPIRNVGNVVGQGSAVATELGKEGASRLTSTALGGGGDLYDAKNPFSSNYGQTPNTSGIRSSSEPIGYAQPASGGATLGANSGGGSAGAGGGSLGGGSGFYDPYAAQRASFVSGLGSAVGNIRNNAMDAFGSAGRNLRGQAESLFNTVNQGQNAINRSRENVELNRLAGVDDILSFVRNGLKSGASRLANMNALESSASGELGRAFGTEGSGRMRKVGNQAFLQDREIDTQQEGLDLQRGQGRTDFSRGRDDMVATIGQQVREQLADLEAQARELGVSGPEVEAEKQRIIDGGIGQLNDVDSWLQNQLGGVSPQDRDATRKNAVALRAGGKGNITPFDFGEFSMSNIGQGPSLDQLPIFTRNRRDQ